MKFMTAAVVLAAVISTPALAQEGPIEGKDGVRIEGRVAWERINDPELDQGINYELGSGIAYGGEIGFDFPVSDRVVVGPYGQYNGSTVEECDGQLCVTSGGYWAAGIHAGLLVGTNGMVYAKAGYGQQTIDLTGPFDDGFGLINFDESETGGGYNFALGYDHSFGQNFYGRIETSISESYDIYGFDFQRSTIGVSLGARF